ncbi:hypothetical protein DES32_1538 [Methylovirgula ligni]|uniref:GIY-YIG domain-containing protein n=2 Tax=Methylovirgula ligni TaxID=569860 RepID=A0A3D9YZ08_9HYPH|nr:hypothetical protein [Methylovirgula ligni]REF87901.1 hypothetical protein DES32_1538 [Methylovirgula ligni]
MSSYFRVYGPFVCDKLEIRKKERQKQFWETVESEVEYLPPAQGVYLFSLRNGSNYMPQYVGITQKQGFHKEVFNNANLTKILGDWRGIKGTLCIHLLARPKDKQKGFSTNVSKEVLKYLERLILAWGRKKNPKMLNIAHAKFLDSVEIEDITTNFSKGKARQPISSFRNAIHW